VSSADDLVPIPAQSIEEGVVPFDIYAALLRGKPVLASPAGAEITLENLENLRVYRRQFFTDAAQLDLYCAYAEKRLDNIISSREVIPDEKARVLGLVGTWALKGIASNPGGAAQMRHCHRFVDGSVEFLLSDPRLLARLFVSTEGLLYRQSHGVNVCTLCLLIGEKLFGRHSSLLAEFGLGGLLADIGKSKIDPRLLEKPGRLSDEELEAVRLHPISGYEILGAHDLPPAVRLMARHHHERADGSGYPDHIPLGKIHPFARIAAVADVYDAVTSERAYGREADHVEALKEMAADARAFDHYALTALFRVVLRDENLVRSFQSRRPVKTE